jgi:hypothetical protein
MKDTQEIMPCAVDFFIQVFEQSLRQTKRQKSVLHEL